MSPTCWAGLNRPGPEMLLPRLWTWASRTPGLVSKAGRCHRPLLFYLVYTLLNLLLSSPHWQPRGSSGESCGPLACALLGIPGTDPVSGHTHRYLLPFRKSPLRLKTLENSKGDSGGSGKGTQGIYRPEVFSLARLVCFSKITPTFQH